ncbi:MAG: hypothetical protein V1492_00565, partial [Candidatus Micrarchaeota archaeon]
ILTVELTNPSPEFSFLFLQAGSNFNRSTHLDASGGITTFTNAFESGDPEVEKFSWMHQAIWPGIILAGHNPYLEGEFKNYSEVFNLGDVNKVLSGSTVLLVGKGTEATVIHPGAVNELNNSLTLNASLIFKDNPQSLVYHKGYVPTVLDRVDKYYLFDIEKYVAPERPKPVVPALPSFLLARPANLDYSKIFVEGKPHLEMKVGDYGSDTFDYFGLGTDAKAKTKITNISMAWGEAKIAASYGTTSDVKQTAADFQKMLAGTPQSKSDYGKDKKGNLTEDGLRWQSIREDLAKAAKDGDKEALNRALSSFEKIQDGMLTGMFIKNGKLYQYSKDQGSLSSSKIGGGATFVLYVGEPTEYAQVWFNISHYFSSTYSSLEEIDWKAYMETGATNKVEGGSKLSARTTERSTPVEVGTTYATPSYQITGKGKLSFGTVEFSSDYEAPKSVDYISIDSLSIGGLWTPLKETKPGEKPEHRLGRGGGGLMLVQPVVRVSDKNDTGLNLAGYGTGGIGGEKWQWMINASALMRPDFIPFLGTSVEFMTGDWTHMFAFDAAIKAGKAGTKEPTSISAGYTLRTPIWLLAGPFGMGGDISTLYQQYIGINDRKAVQTFGGSVSATGNIIFYLDTRKDPQENKKQ